MDREIKFRIWYKLKNYFVDTKNIRINESNRVGENGELLLDFNGQLRLAIYPCGNGDNSADSVFDIFNDKNYIIQQFTGLEDETGKEIYEGDIVKYTYIYEFDKKDESIRQVEFYKGSFCPLPVDDINDADDFYSYRIINYRIIGNIFENPELLKLNV